MSFGINRDYKTTERRAWKVLAKHHAIMTRLIAEGTTREAASAEALRLMERKKKKRATKF